MGVSTDVWVGRVGFFFQAEDGIRVGHVTGVQTCALPISGAPLVLYMETLKKEKGCDWVRVPFRGGGEAVTAILSGSTPIALFGEGNVIGNVRDGQMTPLVMMNNIRSPNFPQVPLLTDVGYSGPPSRSWYGIFTPAGVPKPIVDKVSKDIGEIIA